MPKIPKAQADATAVGTPKKVTEQYENISKTLNVSGGGIQYSPTENYVGVARAKMHPERGDITVSHSEVSGSKRGK